VIYRKGPISVKIVTAIIASFRNFSGNGTLNDGHLLVTKHMTSPHCLFRRSFRWTLYLPGVSIMVLVTDDFSQLSVTDTAR